MIDDTHVIAVVATEKSIPYFGKKGYPTQNVIAACDFDMLFTFVLPRWLPPFFLILLLSKPTTRFVIGQSIVHYDDILCVC